MGNKSSTPSEEDQPATNWFESAECPQITAQPRDKTNAIKTATFTIEATGTDLIYQWERRPPGEGDDDWQLVPTDDGRIKGANMPELGITHLLKSDEGSYRCTVINRAGRVVSNPASLCLADPPQIVAQPQDNRDVIPKQTLKLTIISTSTEPLKYSWEWNGNGVKVVDSARKKAMEGEAASSAIQTFFDKLCTQIAPEKMAPLLYAQRIIHRREMKDATNKYNNEEDRAQALLLVLMRSVQTRPQWFHQICEIFDEVLIESTQDIRVEYQKLLKEAEGWKPIPSDEGRYEGVHTATLTITSVQRSDQGGYRCIVYNDTGSETSEPAVVTVAEAPRISSDPQECEEVIPGEETNMTIKATGTEPLQYSWMYRPLDAIERGINVWALAGGDGVQGADTPTLTITAAQESHQGRYRCVVSNLVGSETSKPGILTIAKPPRIMSHPNVQQKIVPGREACFIVEALGTQPLEYAWMWNSNESAKDAWLPVGGKEVQGADTPTLTITTAQESHQGRYRCVVSNLVGSETSNPALLSLAQPPRIISHPQCEKEVLPQGDVTLSIEAGGSEPLRYSWEWQPQSSEEWLPLEDDDQFEGTATTKLSITNIQKPNSGNYRCVVTSDAGKAISVDVFVNVLGTDAIIHHLEVICRDDSTPMEEKTKAVVDFVVKYGCTSEIVKKCLMAVVGMEREEAEIVRAFLEYPCLVPAEFEQDGSTPLLHACKIGHDKVANLLLENDVQPDHVQSETGKAALHLASEGGHQNSVMWLIYHHADTNLRDREGGTPLHAACKAAGSKNIPQSKLHQLLQLVEYLLKGIPNQPASGARVELQDKVLKTPLHIACESGARVEIVKLLLEYDRNSCSMNCEDNEGNGPLHLACAGGYREIVDLLVLKGASLKQQNQEGNTPLHLAAIHCPDDLMKMLVKQLKRDTVSLYLPNKDSNTPLHLASARGMTETVKKVLKYDGRPINTQNQDGKTPLHMACQGGYRHTAEVLLSVRKADPNAVDMNGNTPLHLAGRGGFQNTFKVLLSKGADPDITNKDGWSPAALLMAFHGHKDMSVQIEGLIRKKSTTTHRTKLPSVSQSGVFEGVNIARSGSSSSTDSASGRPSNGYGSQRSGFPNSNSSESAATRAAKSAMAKCSKNLATQLKPSGIITTLVDKGLVDRDEYERVMNPLLKEQQQMQLLLKYLLKKVDKESFDTICTIFETINSSAATSDLRLEYSKELKFLLLKQACKQANTEEIKTIIQDCGPDSEIVQKVLVLAVTMEEQQLDAVKVFMESGASPNTTQYGQTLIQYACMTGHRETVDYLLERGADKQVLTEDKRNLLHLACQKGHSGVVLGLIDNGIPVDQRDKKLRTPLHVACEASRIPSSPDSPSVRKKGSSQDSPSMRKKGSNASVVIVEHLLKQKAARDAKDVDGNTPLHTASKSGNADVVRILLENDPEHRAINSPNKVGNTPLHVAASAGYHHVVIVLIQYDADPTFLNQEHETSAELARFCGHPELAHLLSKQSKLDDIRRMSGRMSKFYSPSLQHRELSSSQEQAVDSSDSELY